MSLLDRQLLRLKHDYTAETGQPFKHFACPITLRDEPGKLCLGHVVNEAFPNSSRRRIVQRADVDNFFGSGFESQFVKLRHKGKHHLARYLTDPRLGKDLPPSFRLDGQTIEHYFTKVSPARDHTEIGFPGLGPGRRLVLKIHPEVLATKGPTRLEFGVEADLRIPAFVASLKSAHLTLFCLLGYHHALSLAGRFLGSDLLGALYTKHRRLRGPKLMEAAWPDLRGYASMVRPVISAPASFRGTIVDRTVLICRTQSSAFWGLVVFIRTGPTLHAILTPVFDTDTGVGRYFEFLNSNGQHFEATVGRFVDGAWQLSPNWSMMAWPKTDLPS